MMFQSLFPILVVTLLPYSLGFSITPDGPIHSRPSSGSALRMGLFDGIAKAFTNQDFKSSDQRVRASHILIKGADNVQRTEKLMEEINERTLEDPERKLIIFAEAARQNSQCPSSTNGGDLGEFGPGKMVRDFDLALFPEDGSEPPVVGDMVGPIPTEFGCHVIFVTKRDTNKDQVSAVPHPDRFQR